MDSLLFALNAIMPIVLTVALGYILKRIGIMPMEFAKAGNKIAFRVCLPALLFLNVYNMTALDSIEADYVIYAVIFIAAVFAVNLFLVRAITYDPGSRGALLQNSFRSNFALIGIPLAQSLCGSEGVAVSALLSAVTIPFFNILAVVSLSVFSNDGKRPSLRKILKGIVTNPLIASIFLGFAVLALRSLPVNQGIDFRLSEIKPLFKVLSYLSDMATPLALLVLGAQFEFSAVSGYRKELLYGVIMRNILVPSLGLGLAYIFFSHRFGGAQFASFIALFATPVAVSSVPMAQEMKSNAELAGQLLVFTTIISAFSVGAASFILKYLGVFG